MAFFTSVVSKPLQKCLRWHCRLSFSWKYSQSGSHGSTSLSTLFRFVFAGFCFCCRVSKPREAEVRQSGTPASLPFRPPLLPPATPLIDTFNQKAEGPLFQPFFIITRNPFIYVEKSKCENTWIFLDASPIFLRYKYVSLFVPMY